jgi:hypothetical protein
MFLSGLLLSLFFLHNVVAQRHDTDMMSFVTVSGGRLKALLLAI